MEFVAIVLVCVVAVLTVLLLRSSRDRADRRTDRLVGGGDAAVSARQEAALAVRGPGGLSGVFDPADEATIDHGDVLVVADPQDHELFMVFGDPRRIRAYGFDNKVGAIPSQLARAAVGGNALARAGIEVGEQAGFLVRLTPESARRMRELNQIKDSTGAVMGVLRDGSGRFRHVVKFRPAQSLQAVTGVTGILSAVAMQAQLAAIERAIAAVAIDVRRVQRTLDIRAEAEVAAVEGLLAEAYRSSRAVGVLSQATWDEVSTSTLAVRQNQEYAFRILNSRVDELRSKKSVKDRRSWLKGHGAELLRALEDAERTSLAASQYAALRVWWLVLSNDPSLDFHLSDLRERLEIRQESMQELHDVLLGSLDRASDISGWQLVHSPFDSRSVRRLAEETRGLLMEVGVPVAEPTPAAELPLPTPVDETRASSPELADERDGE